MQALKGKRTYIYGVLIMILGALQTDPNFAALLGPWQAVVTGAIGFGILVLRSITNTSPMQREQGVSKMENPYNQKPDQ
jgi:hypothetical protein